MSHDGTGRRALLAGFAGSLAGVVAGCASVDDRSPRRSHSSDERDGDASTVADDDSASGPDDDSTTSSDSGTSDTEREADDDSEAASASESESKSESEPESESESGSHTNTDILLPSLDVQGSPGDLVSIHPPEVVRVLYFFATWCPPCEPEMENLGAAIDEFDDDELFVVSITQEQDQAVIEEFWEDTDGNWPVVMDPDMRSNLEYNATTIPTIVVLAADGSEIARHTGLVGEETLVEDIETALEHGESA